MIPAKIWSVLKIGWFRVYRIWRWRPASPPFFRDLLPFSLGPIAPAELLFPAWWLTLPADLSLRWVYVSGTVLFPTSPFSSFPRSGGPLSSSVRELLWPVLRGWWLYSVMPKFIGAFHTIFLLLQEDPPSISFLSTPPRSSYVEVRAGSQKVIWLCFLLLYVP